MRILVIEDEDLIRSILVDILEDEAYLVDASSDGEEGLYKALHWDYDCILLDVMLPKLNGYKVLTLLREQKTTPVIILTARDSLEDKVYGLNHGADDFILKPFEIDEVLARVRSLTRRVKGTAHPVIKFNDLTLNLNTKEVTQEGVRVELTAQEYALIELLALQRGTVLSRKFLCSHLFKEEGESSNLLDVYIYKVRNKLGKELVKTRRGLGFVIE